jgi:hypothetical protein
MMYVLNPVSTRTRFFELVSVGGYVGETNTNLVLFNDNFGFISAGRLILRITGTDLQKIPR